MKGGELRFIQRACCLGLALLAPAAAMADGIVLSQRAYAIPDIPEQRALIHYADGIETLVIETSFTGGGSNVAWIVPLPAPPKVEPASTGLFPTLQVIFSPRIVLSVAPWWLALPVAAILFGLYRFIQRYGMFVFLLSLSPVLLLSPLFLPSPHGSSEAAMSVSTLASVQVLNRQRAGLFDTVTLRSREPAALMHWLEQNGFRAPTNIAPVIADYVRDGWVFSAARMDSRADQGALRATHPLVFKFKTERPVYPLRLTGKASSFCRIDLYVFGPGRASLPGFTVQRCERPRYDEPQRGRLRLESTGLNIRQEDLAKQVRGAAVATKLSGNLSSGDMEHDAYVSWNTYWKSGGKQYGGGAALTFSANVAALTLLVIAGCLIWTRAHGAPLPNHISAWVTTGAVAVAVVVYAGLPKTNAAGLRNVSLESGEDEFRARSIAGDLGSELAPMQRRLKGSPDLPLSREALEKTFQATVCSNALAASRDLSDRDPRRNLFTGEPVRLEASPGNFAFRCVRQLPPTTNGAYVARGTVRYELVWHDWDGAEARTNSFEVER